MSQDSNATSAETSVAAAGEKGPEGEVAFESLLERLTGIVSELERGDASLERSLILFEEGVRLARVGTQRLDRAEARVEELLGRDLRTLDPRELESKRGAAVSSKEPR